jgi:hypothetical protein
MRVFLQTSWRVAALVTLLVGATICARAQSARVQLDQLDSLASRATDTVDVTLDEHLLQTTANFFSSKDPDDAEVKDLIKGLKGIYVKSFTFDKEGEYSPAEVASITSQLRGGGWKRIVSINSRKEGENVEVYLMMSGDQIGGLVVVSAEPKELTVVNIIGPIDLEKLSKLEGQFGVPELGIESKPPKK